MKIAELFVQLGFKSDTTKLHDFIHSMGELNLSSVLSAMGLKEVLDVTKQIMDTAEKTALGINSFTKETGLSGKKMQQFSQFAEQMGASADDAVSGIKALQMNVLKVRMGEGNIRPFTLTGISPFQDTFKIMDEIHKKMIDPSINDAVKRMIISEFGLSESMATVLKSSDAEWNSIKRLGSVTDEQVGVLMQYHKAWTEVGQQVNLFIVKLAGEYAPGLISFGKFVRDAIINTSDWIPVLRNLGETLIGIAAIFIPWLRIPYLLSMIATHFDQVTQKAKEFGDILQRVIHPFANGDISKMLMLPNMPLVSGGIGVLGGEKFKQNNNTFHFTVSGGDPKSIVNEIDKHLKKVFGDTDFQTPLEQK